MTHQFRPRKDGGGGPRRRGRSRGAEGLPKQDQSDLEGLPEIDYNYFDQKTPAELLKLAKERGARSRESVEALLFLRRLWNALIEDLSHPENGLPQALRASLISVGLWILKEADLVRLAKSENFDGLIEMNTILRDGLN